MALSARTGRLTQRYNNGCRLIVGCIPYRLVNHATSTAAIEVLMVSSQNWPKAMLFPKGGWENDETKEEGAVREAHEEAGVVGVLQEELGEWYFKGGKGESYRQGYMFPLLVTEELDNWPEMIIRNRKWMKVGEGRDACKTEWMKEALDILVVRLQAAILPTKDALPPPSCSAILELEVDC